ncbi:hypothetical protein BG000_000867 [Podila horticola]|nr:hypothetical protein BG000_000867 [Podila horticola]
MALICHHAKNPSEREVTKYAGQLPRVIKAPVSSSTDNKLEDFPDVVPATPREHHAHPVDQHPPVRRAPRLGHQHSHRRHIPSSDSLTSWHCAAACAISKSGANGPRTWAAWPWASPSSSRTAWPSWRTCTSYACSTLSTRFFSRTTKKGVSWTWPAQRMVEHWPRLREIRALMYIVNNDAQARPDVIYGEDYILHQGPNGKEIRERKVREVACPEPAHCFVQHHPQIRLPRGRPPDLQFSADWESQRSSTWRQL